MRRKDRDCIGIVHTGRHIFGKANARFPPPTLDMAWSKRLGGYASGADRKDSIDLRIEGRTRQLMDDAAAVPAKTRTGFMTESARRQAIEEWLDWRLFERDA